MVPSIPQIDLKDPHPHKNFWAVVVSTCLEIKSWVTLSEIQTRMTENVVETRLSPSKSGLETGVKTKTNLKHYNTDTHAQYILINRTIISIFFIFHSNHFLSWFRAVKILVHFTGLTGESRNIRLVLQSLCIQLAEAYSPHTQLSEVLYLIWLSRILTIPT